jgi:hypothetical protein
MKKLCIIFCTYFWTLPINPVVILSIGGDCASASALRISGLRKAAYPFDWIVSPFSSVYQAFKDDFKHFLETASLHIRSDNHGIIDYYGFQFVHDFPTIENNDTNSIHTETVLSNNWAEAIPEIQTKYNRRINRLRSVLHGTEPVVFVRRTNDKKQVIAFRSLIKNLYPQLSFLILVAESFMDTNWHEENVKNFYVNDSIKWNNIDDWLNVFKELGLTPETTKYLSFDDDDNDHDEDYQISCAGNH